MTPAAHAILTGFWRRASPPPRQATPAEAEAIEGAAHLAAYPGAGERWMHPEYLRRWLDWARTS